MAKLGFILTTDYEIFGNGTGSVERCMLEPTRKMVTILEKYNAPLTIFLDVCEYWAFEAEYEKGNLKEDRAGKIRQQLQELISRGHDVQLHAHPQWLDYKLVEDGWLLNFNYWRTSSLPFSNNINQHLSLNNLFNKGKVTLEEIVKPVNPKYKCNVFRAGAWSIQPEEEVLKALLENNFAVDSSVAKGMKFGDDFTFYDFTQAPDLPSWKITERVDKQDAKGVLTEIPIFTAQVPLLKRLQFLNQRRNNKHLLKPEGCEGTAIATKGKSKFDKIRELLLKSRSMFNFSDAVSSEEMIYFANKALRKYSGANKLIPIVAISHPKTFANEKELEKFMEWAAKNEEIKFTNYQEFIDE